MTLDELFETIRSENCVLWAGAGFSAQAGYPTAARLADKILKKLPRDKQESMGSKPKLEDVAQEFIYAHNNSRAPLLTLLKRIYSKVPKDNSLHRTLAQLPQIKTIVTTNYDTLFEIAYGATLDVITKVPDLVRYDSRKRHLFKIHGDVNNLGDIIITQKDYSEFYNERSDNPFWTTIKEKIINNNIIFIGYGFADINIQTIVSKISKELGTGRRKIILIAPGFDASHVAALAADRITYIDCDGQRFVEGLAKNIHENIILDFKRKWISNDMMGTYINQSDLQIDLLANGLSYDLANLRTVSGIPLKGKVILKADSEIHKQFTNILNRKNIDPVEVQLQPDDMVLNIHGIKFLDSAYTSKLQLMIKPKEFTADVEFENGFKMRKIPIESLFSDETILVKIKLGVKKFVIRYSTVTKMTNFSYENLNFFNDTGDEVDSFLLLKYLGEGIKFNLIGPNNLQTQQIATIDGSFLKHAEQYLQIYRGLNKVERYFGFKIASRNEMTPAYVDLINYLATIIDTGLIQWKDDGETEINFTEQEANFVDQLKSVNDEGRDITVESLNQSFEFFGHTLMFTRRVATIHDAHIVNLEEVISRQTNKMKVISKSKQFSETFSI